MQSYQFPFSYHNLNKIPNATANFKRFAKELISFVRRNKTDNALLTLKKTEKDDSMRLYKLKRTKPQYTTLDRNNIHVV